MNYLIQTFKAHEGKTHLIDTWMSFHNSFVPHRNFRFTNTRSFSKAIACLHGLGFLFLKEIKSVSIEGKVYKYIFYTYGGKNQ